ncbi:MAG: hypothetical protein HKN54_10945 [Flavobacteriaceae bacterium]|nr:hypothetical protein [Flavobacteriaceae bacterium]
MNILNILKGLENLAVELLLWIVYIPKTIYRVVKNPFWVRKYVNEQLQKEQKFQDYMSPVLLYLGTSVILYVLVDFIWTSSKQVDILNEIGMIKALLFLSLPMFVALMIELFRRAPFSRALILRSLYIQCYFFSPLMLAYFAYELSNYFWIMEEGYESSPIISEIPYYLFVLTLVWFVIVEIKFIANDLKINRYKSFGIVLFCFSVLLFGFVYFSMLSDTTKDENGMGQPENAEFTVKKEDIYDIHVVNISSFSEVQFDLILQYTDSIQSNIKVMDDANPLEKTMTLDEPSATNIQSPDTMVEEPLILQESQMPDELPEFRIIPGKYYADLNTTNRIQFNGEKEMKYSLKVIPKDNFDIALNVYDKNFKSLIPIEKKWAQPARWLYIILFGYAVFIGFKAFFRKSHKAVEAKSQEENTAQKPIEGNKE